ncbi:MAG: class I SAM-dependent methyltransferase [Deltaproteobacteria bacterium]|nr:class I SAM-dependent methyltransferase [Deltaproteobacteria bacterium]
MTLLDLINRTPVPAPWSEGDNIPWDDPQFSERMLREHLSQDHDLASRRGATIDNQVEWIFSAVMGDRPGKVLDLACGPGLYTQRLAAKGCECVGLDFSPASIRYAAQVAGDEGFQCTYRPADLRDGAFGSDFELVMFIYGQLNVFPRDRGRDILQNAHQALRPGGSLLLEIQSDEQIRRAARGAPSWYSAPSGLFSDSPHIVLQENFWDDEARASTSRFLVLEGQSGSVGSYALSNEAYTTQELSDLLTQVGFCDVRWQPSLLGKPLDGATDLPVILAHK